MLGGACLTKTQAKARRKIQREMFLERVETSEANFRCSMAKMAKGLLYGFVWAVRAYTLIFFYGVMFIISAYEKARLKIPTLSRRLYKWLLARIS